MLELETDLWTILLPSEWQAEQDEETVVIFDEDEVSIIELTPLMPEKNSDTDALLAGLIEPHMVETVLADMPAYYHELEDDDMFWREWYCHAGGFVLTVSHGTDSENKGLDDGSVNEILSTLLINEE